MKKRIKPSSIRRPVIGITCEVNKLKPFYAEFDLRCDYRYVRSILRAGGTPVLLPIIPFRREVSKLVHFIDGLVITGGADIPPSFYGEKASTKVDPMYRGRIYFEKLLFQAAQKKKIPVLAICYGMQFLNVIQGGTLYQDIQSEVPKVKSHRSKRHSLHRVKLFPGSDIRKILRTESCWVHSEHHQAVKTPGKWITVSAFSEDGIPEAIQGLKRTIAVQWHPERQPKDKIQRRIFKHFLKMCRARLQS